MKHALTPWVLKNAYPGSNLNYYQIFDADGDGVLGQDSVTMGEFSITEETAKRIVNCVNAMEGIDNPRLLRKYWDEQMFNEVKSNYVKTSLLSKEELQKLGEQYANQEETPYVETSKPLKATQIVTKSKLSMPKELYELEAEMIEKIMNFHKDAIKYHNLKEVIQNILDRLDEGAELTLTKDSIIVLALKEAIK